MKKALQTLTTTILIIVAFFGLGIYMNLSSLFNFQILMLILATIVMFETQPKLEKEDFNNPSDKYSMIGIALVSVLITNANLFEWTSNKNSSQSISFMNIIGFLMIWGGLAFRIYAIKKLGRFFAVVVKTQNDHELYDKDVYAYIRHPSYTGAIITIIGTVVWLASWQVLPFGILLIALAYYHRITQEEKVLEERLGEKYILYKQKTGALLPKLSVLIDFLKRILKYFRKR
jgi:protein-S-isoprenylcysteine O-methyltransferase Ste14